MRKLRIYNLIICLGLVLQGYGQITVESTETVEYYVQNVLLGEGISATNITFNGLPANEVNLQCGFFNSVNSNVGIDSGLVMATGNINVVVGPNNQGGATQAPPVSTDGDDDLEMIAGIQVNDVAILEFDFIPSSDSVSFNYVFSSEEYLEYVGSINDVFGFFISGPNITGPFSSPPAFPDGSTNIALIPNSSDAVSIFNVNDVQNSEYYVNNEIVTGNNEIQMDGLTVVLTAVSEVVCGELHHIKLAIADASDDILDSAVFLEAGSFQSAPEDLVLDTYFEPGIVESSGVCDSSFANFNRVCAADSAFYILKFQGDAQFGVDYEVFNVPDTIVMIPDQFVHAFGILAFDDGIVEDAETIEVILCASANRDEEFLPQDTAYLEITDNFSLPIISPDINLICPADEVIITAEAPDGVPAIQYTWLDSNGDEVGLGPILSVPVPDESATYTIDVIDFCGFTGLNSVTVTNNIPPDPTVSITEDPDPFCPGTPFDLDAVIQDGTPGFTYSWTTGDLDESTQITPPQGSLATIPVSVFITDFCNRVAEATVDLTPPTPPQPLIGLNDFLCIGDPLPLQTFIADGTGTPPYTFLYTDITNGGIVNPDFYSTTSGLGEINGLTEPASQEYQVLVTDYCYQFDNTLYAAIDADTVEVIACFIPNVFTPNDDNQNDTFQVFELLSKSGTLHIFNRWGVELMSSRNFEWTGEDYPGGTYFYIVEFDDGSEPKKGSFTMLR